MGRRNQITRSGLRADREQRQPRGSFRRQTFGLHRPLAEEDEDRIFQSFSSVVKGRSVFRDLLRRSQLHVTLLELSDLEKKVADGLATGYEFGKAVTAVEHNVRNSRDMILSARLGRAAVYKSRIIVMEVVSPELMRENTAIVESLVRTGFRHGFRERKFRPHITLGQVATPLNDQQRGEVIAGISSGMPLGTTVDLMPIERYPQDQSRADSA